MTDGRVDQTKLELAGPLVDGSWLVRHLEDPRLAVADVRWYLDGRSGYEAWIDGHIPGAVWVDLDRDLAGPAGGDRGRHPLPTPESFASAMERMGIGDDTLVVAYDDTGGMTAGRLWWMLFILGHPVAVLDGGLAGWSGPLEVGDSNAPRRLVSFTPRPWPSERIVESAGVGDRPDGVIVVDARSPERFRGDANPIDTRPGHIPGARNVPWASNLDPTTGRFRSPEELRARYRSVGIVEGTGVIASCGSGISACADLLALEIAGVGTTARLFTASWSGWSADPARPAEIGPDVGN